ncbi:Hypothetical predicted protein [Mytilus galloprovincialis]|uniref:Reverse transcriptase domain-containing protein n=1 Tax=Mytilus galloprovincialis TaxID=29158 RepID=A0A8B6DRR2_MYTGA|nr:Hypothetical predicted protein [Mytilus galloprovincialis]
MSIKTFCICVCYLPPKGSTRTNDPEQFYSDLTRQVYMYQNLGKLYILVVGDFNSRCLDTSDFIEGIDELPNRETIDQGSNANGDLLIEFLVDCNICMINGRKGKQNFTCISKRGKSVADDYIFTTHENLNSCIDFNVKTMSDITDFLDLQECIQIPDHSVLQVLIKREVSVPHNTVLKFPTNLKRIPNKPKSYQIPNDFLNDDNAREKIEQTINEIENELADRRDVDEAYSNLFQLINSEVISKIGHKSAHDDQHKITSRNDEEYDEGFLTFIQQQVDHNLVNNIENNSDTLNSDISYEDVEKSVYRAKLNTSTGLDQICAEFLCNNSCVDMIFKIVKFAFDNGVVPETWNQILINPILKPDKDNCDPLGYRVITLMSIPCKIYADILNVRLSSWLEDNKILDDEQNGFRKDRGCMIHLFALTTLITIRKIERITYMIIYIYIIWKTAKIISTRKLGDCAR